ncbi:MAG: glycosyltransferase [Thermotogota bacterium]|nr:glycosyltransferase [Thermotogota bacterium]
MNDKIRVVKLVDYWFQHKHQLLEAYDDSNSMRYLSDDIDPFLVGRFNCEEIEIYEPDKKRDYTVVFLPKKFSQEDVALYIVHSLVPDVIHMHGNHGWNQYPFYASYFKNSISPLKLIFSPAGSSCGTPQFLRFFDYIIVNHKSQMKRMKIDGSFKGEILVRRRSADPSVFRPDYAMNKDKVISDFIYVAGFVPSKRIDEMINTVSNSYNFPPKNLTILGDFSRTREHYEYIKKYIDHTVWWPDTVKLHDFVPQTKMAALLGRAKVFVWPNIKPENPETTTNRSIIEALACGMPLLLGERAFKDTEFVKENYNGFLYSDAKDFNEKANRILRNLWHFRLGSSVLFNEKFSFRENFIEFYNRLYLGEI